MAINSDRLQTELMGCAENTNGNFLCVNGFLRF